MKYKEIEIHRSEPNNEHSFMYTCELTDNFFEYLNCNQNFNVPVKRVYEPTEHKNPFAKEIEYNSIVITRKMRGQVAEEDLKDLDNVFLIVIDYLNEFENVKCFFIERIVWSHIFHPTGFCPIPGLLIRYNAQLNDGSYLFNKKVEL